MIHSTAVIDTDAKIGADVSIGPFTVVHGSVEIGEGSTIGSHCSIGESSGFRDPQPLVIGERAVIRSHSVLYAGSTIGPRLETGHHVTLREGLKVGENLRVGTLSDLQGDAQIGDFVRMHSNVFVAKLSQIGSFVWIFPYVILTNDPTPPSDAQNHGGVLVEDFAVISSRACIAPGVRVGSGSLIGASSMVTRDVEPETVVLGVPARLVGPADRIMLRDGSGRPAYPWTTHFTRGYPPEIVRQWEGELGGW